MADSPFIVEIDEQNYEQVVLQGSYRVPVLVDFWASWCQPCQMLMPVLAKLADEYQGRFVLAKINTEQHQALAAEFGVRGIPDVRLFRDGQPVDGFSGALPESAVREFLDRHLPRESDGTVVEAEQKLLAGDVDGALQLLAEAREADPSNPRIVLAMAQAQAIGGDVDAAEQLLDGLPGDEQDKPETRQLRGQLYFDRIALVGGSPAEVQQRARDNPDDSEARFQLAAQLVVQNDVEAAMEGLLTLMQRDRKFGDDAARLALLKLFDMLGDDPRVTRYRARMFNLLH